MRTRSLRRDRQSGRAQQIAGHPCALCRADRPASRYERLLAPLDGFARCRARLHAPRRQGRQRHRAVQAGAHALAASTEPSARRRPARSIRCASTATRSLATTPTASAWSPTSCAMPACALRGKRDPAAGRRRRGARRDAAAAAASSRRELVIANRTRRQGARNWRSSLRTQASIAASDFAELLHGRFDIVINATSASLPADAAADRRRSCSAPARSRYDMMYGNEPTRVHALRAQHGRARARRPRHAGRAGRRIVFRLARRAAGHRAGAGRIARRLDAAA